MDAPSRVLLRRLFNYIWSFWINTVGVVAFSVFGKVHGSNNLSESTIYWLTQLMNGHHVTIWKFLGNFGIKKK